MRVLITGSKGFIGKNLLERIKNDYEVYELNEEIFDSENWYLILQLILVGIKPSVIFHVGACSDTMQKDVQFMMIRNFEATKIFSDYCKENSIPIIYSSSAASYGVNNQHPSNLYGWSKYVAEQYVISNGGIALRYFNVYGPGEELKGTMASVAYQMFEKNKRGESIKIFPQNPKRDFIYVDDVIDANLFGFENYDHLCGEYYDVGFGESRSFEDVLNILGLNYTYHPEWMIPEGYQFITCSDKNKWMTEWNPKYNLEEGLQKYLVYLNGYQYK
jgi:ADP-L-glycero-D-manno-heptose 6-epimerase